MSGGGAFWLIGFCGKAFTLFESYLSNRYIRDVTSLDTSHLCCVTTGVPQGAIWSPSLFNLYIRQLPTILKHSMIVGYADDHSLLKIIPDKADRITAASDLNCDLAALYHFGQSWQIRFAPNKTFSLIISLKRDLQLLPHPPSLSTIVLNSRDRQGMYGMQHFRVSNNKPYNKL